MDAYAVVKTGGKQYMVKAGDTLQVDRLEAEVGNKVELCPVLAMCDGKDIRIGSPELAGATVTSTVMKHIRGVKLVSFKKRRRKGYARKKGHRQELTVLRVESIQ